MRFTVSLAKEIREFFSSAGAHWKGLSLVLIIILGGLATIGLAAKPAVLNYMINVDVLKDKLTLQEKQIAVITQELHACNHGWNLEKTQRELDRIANKEQRDNDRIAWQKAVDALRYDLMQLRKQIELKN